jgi:hypothetical protein
MLFKSNNQYGLRPVGVSSKAESNRQTETSWNITQELKLALLENTCSFNINVLQSSGFS